MRRLDINGGEADPRPSLLSRRSSKRPVDLLFFGGIGTFIKASSESHADASDKGNDSLRIDGKDVRAKVVGEGANLGVTQRGRIEYAMQGGRIDTDAIDNSAGVDTSDHEVNIKILLNAVMAAGKITLAQRNALLQQMTDEIAAHVLRDNYLQGIALSLAESHGVERIDGEARLIRDLERAGRLDRAIEYLPTERSARGARSCISRAATRPELSVLLAYVKNTLTEDLIDSDFPDDPQLAADLFGYFPKLLTEKFRDAIEHHRLRRELIATVAANDLVNRTGITFLREISVRTGRTPGGRASPASHGDRALEVLGFLDGALWGRYQSPRQQGVGANPARDGQDRAAPRRARHGVVPRRLEARYRGAGVAAHRPGRRVACAEHIGEFMPGLHKAELCAASPPSPAKACRRIWQGVAAARFPSIRGRYRAASLKTAQRDFLEAGRRFYAIGSHSRSTRCASPRASSSPSTQWQKLAVSALIEDLYAHQADLTARALHDGGDFAPWLDSHARDLGRLDTLVREIDAATTPDLAMLTVANRGAPGVAFVE